MKKLFLLLTILLSAGLLVSCHDDETIKDTGSVTVTLDNVALVNGVLYATRDYPLEIESFTLTNSSGSTKAITEVTYSLDNTEQCTTIFSPFNSVISTQNLEEGIHTLQLSYDMMQYDSSIVPDDLYYSIVIVPGTADIPNGAELGTYSRVFTTNN